MFAIKSILSGFIEIINENTGMSLGDLVKRVAKIKSLFTIAAVLMVVDYPSSRLPILHSLRCFFFFFVSVNQDQSVKSEFQRTLKYKVQSDAFSDELDFCCQQVAEHFAADKQLWPTVHHARSLVSSFSCVNEFRFHESSKF